MSRDDFEIDEIDMEEEIVKKRKIKGKTKLCKHCKEEIREKAKICPYCNRKQSGGCLPWVIGGIVLLLVISVAGGSGETENKDENPQKVQNSSNSNNQSEAVSEIDNEFVVGDVIETNNLKISYLSAEEYVSDNQFLQPKDGCVYYKAEFEFENISNTDQYISIFDFEGYADGYSIEQSYIGDDTLSATLSTGKKAKGSVYYEVPKDAKEVILEYETNYWTESKIIFIVKQ